MTIFCKPVAACSPPGLPRPPTRALLRKAANGDSDAYIDLSRAYFDLICEYLYLCNFDRASALRATRFLLHEGWKRLPVMQRLSDWEHFLASNLQAIQPKPSCPPGEKWRPRPLLEIPPSHKFALIAFDLENWDYPWLALALRLNRNALRKVLFETRCKLLGIDPKQTDRALCRCLALVSADMDGQLRRGQKRKALKKVCGCQDTKSFKSRWLACRCNLIEMRQQIRLPEEEREAFLYNLGGSLSPEEMLQPGVLRRLLNVLSFNNLPCREVVSANGLLRQGDS